MSVLVSQLVADTRVLSGLRSNQLFTDAQIAALLSDASGELHDEMVASFQHYFVSKFDFTLTGAGPGNNLVALPADFEKDNSLERNPLLPNPEVITALGSWLERNQCAGVISGGGARRYFVTGDFLEVFPLAMAAGDYRLYYTPQFTPIVLPAPTALPATCATTGPMGFVASGGAGPGHQLILPNPGGTFTIDGFIPIANAVEALASKVLVLYEATASNNGYYRCAENDAGGFSLVRMDAYDQNTEIHTGDQFTVAQGLVNGGTQWSLASAVINIDVSPLVFVSVFQFLAGPLVPWALYLKTHASIAIRTSRGQATDQLEAKLAALVRRVARATKNRTEAPKQAPMTRRGGYGPAGSGGGNW